MNQNKVQDVAFLDNVFFPIMRNIRRSGYFTLEFEGAEHAPKRGPVIYVANHSGWLAVDALLFFFAVRELAGVQISAAVVNDFLLTAPVFKSFLKRMGAIPASALKHPDRLSNDIKQIGIFPEGAEGNCKPFWRAYQMAPWKTGFLRWAAHYNATIVPATIVGMEECLPSLYSIEAFRKLLHFPIPIPLSLFPLPTKCKITLLEPIPCPIPSDPVNGFAVGELRAHARRIQGIVQKELDRQTEFRLIRKTGSFHRLCGLFQTHCPES